MIFAIVVPQNHWTKACMTDTVSVILYESDLVSYEILLGEKQFQLKFSRE